MFRNIAQYLKERNAIVSAFYASNVEYYLDEQKKHTFWKTAATLPVDPSSRFIRWMGVRDSATMQTVVSPMRDFFKQIDAGRFPGIR